MQWSDIPKNPSEKMLRQFGGLCFLFFGAISLYGFWHKSSPTLPLLLMAVAILTGLCGIIKPSLLKYIFIGWMILAFPIGFVVSKIILLSVFLFVFTPVSIVFRLIGRDALALRKSPDPNGSYWRAKTQPTDSTRYLKQY